MEQKRVILDRQTWDHFVGSVKRFLASGRVGLKAKLLFVALLALMFGVNGLNVINSYVGRDFMTAIEDRNRAEFIYQALLYVGVFVFTTIVAVFFRYTEERLGLLWREWATRRSIFTYGNNRVYHRLKSSEVGNPDQRISEDIRTYTATTLSFVLMGLNSTFTVIAFSGVMWSISPWLFMVAVLYAAAGSSFIFVFGRPLVRLNYDQLDKEANLRSSLTYLRSNADSVALTRREGGLMRLELGYLREVVDNFRRIININRRVNFCAIGYNWLIQIIPALIVAPLFIDGKVQFGVITQSAIAFTQLTGAFSLIITQFQSISSYTAVIARLSAMIDASGREAASERTSPMYDKDDGRIAYAGLTLRSPRSNRILIDNLNLEVPRGKNLLVQGTDESARAALFNATAGLWEVSEGRITRPRLDKIMFLGELPYLPSGTLRELLLRPLPEVDHPDEATLEKLHISDDELFQVLRMLKIQTLLTGFGGLDTRQHWENVLPLFEQKLLVIARVLLSKPSFAFLDRPGTSLGSDLIDTYLEMFRQRNISYVIFEERGGSLAHFDYLLELDKGGAWVCRPVGDDHRLQNDIPCTP